ncbi:hypothetical protein LTR56_021451 [Elasticomyces elasticus]|nr:hypothetical protein LTR56_021451 [Elasticomyces elasticus]KAK3632857.1 hypothetical protein LTR22_020408 [Elasticomyces elasticus]KAK4912172.1 hypothetical protein LTR49_019360 [Elasticomyces elasticus]KAK5747674.1 hypothetical protein LTS12_022274 [Elasticomyces elasticus]
MAQRTRKDSVTSITDVQPDEPLPSGILAQLADMSRRLDALERRTAEDRLKTRRSVLEQDLEARSQGRAGRDGDVAIAEEEEAARILLEMRQG